MPPFQMIKSIKYLEKNPCVLQSYLFHPCCKRINIPNGYLCGDWNIQPKRFSI